jgi:hypothetical protein
MCCMALCCCVVLYCGVQLQVYSYARTPATLAVTIAYFQLIVMVVCAVLLFGEVPNWWSVLGMALIVASTVLLLFVSARAHGEDDPQPQPQAQDRSADSDSERAHKLLSPTTDSTARSVLLTSSD